MGSNIPLVIVVAILAVISVTALIAAFVTEKRTFSGYEDIRQDIDALKARLSAEVFRDGNDLVISGSEKKLPVVVRFSYGENTPGLNIRVHGPSTMNFVVIPRNSQFQMPENVRATISVPDEMFNSRFLTRADDSAAARMFLMGRATVKELQKALCSSRTTLFITHGALELSETTIPQYAGNHAAGHIDSLMQMSAVLAQMPGAQLAVVEKPTIPRRFLMKAAIAMGAAAAILTIVGAARQLREQPTPIAQPANQLPVEERSAGVPAVDAKLIPGLDNYRVVKPAEMNQKFVAWLKSRGIEAEGRVPLKLNKNSQGTEASEDPDVAYLLTDPSGSRRLVILSSGKVILDAPNFGPVSIARVRSDDMPPVPDQYTKVPEGDGLLVVGDPSPPEKSYLLYLSGTAVQNMAEPNWSDLNIH